jgi:hypothetical protein
MNKVITITEGLQELKVISARVEKKHEFIMGFLYRQNNLRDPHEKNGGSAALIAIERQAIRDLENRKISIRKAINEANKTNTITVLETTRTIEEWLIWRRDVAPGEISRLDAMSRQLANVRADAFKKGLGVTTSPSPDVTSDVVVNLNEAELAALREQYQETLLTLDGQLSLKNATITIEV